MGAGCSVRCSVGSVVSGDGVQCSLVGSVVSGSGVQCSLVGSVVSGDGVQCSLVGSVVSGGGVSGEWGRGAVYVVWWGQW